VVQELEVSKDPLNRRHQAKIDAFIGEVKIIRDSLISQQAVTCNLEDDLDNDELRLAAMKPFNPARELLREATYALSGKRDSIEELLESSQNLLEIVRVAFLPNWI
jgi:hypothetical protein